VIPAGAGRRLGENLVEGVYIPRAPELFEEFAEAPDNGLVLFRHNRGLLSTLSLSGMVWEGRHETPSPPSCPRP
jgi:hypothetical protein